MKLIIATTFFISLILSCQNPAPESQNTITSEAADSTSIAGTVHGFYQWYDSFINDRANDIVFTKIEGDHYILDTFLLDKYLSRFVATGFVSDEFISNQKSYWNACEQLWKDEGIETEILSGTDADKFFCAQDWDIEFWTKAPVKVSPVGENRAFVTLFGSEAGSPREQNFEMVKKDEKWLIADIECDMGINQ
jgi:hypothetical protein